MYFRKADIWQLLRKILAILKVPSSVQRISSPWYSIKWEPKKRRCTELSDVTTMGKTFYVKKGPRGILAAKARDRGSIYLRAWWWRAAVTFASHFSTLFDSKKVRSTYSPVPTTRTWSIATRYWLHHAQICKTKFHEQETYPMFIARIENVKNL